MQQDLSTHITLASDTVWSRYSMPVVSECFPDNDNCTFNLLLNIRSPRDGFLCRD